MEDLETLYRKYYDRVYYYVLGMCHDSSLAEEITQETFFKVLNKIGTFKGECRVSVWITQIAKNTYYNYCRKKRIDPEIQPEELSDGFDLEERIADKECARQIHLILHKMEEPYKEVFWMRTFGELSFREIGALHEKTESWARVTYYRAKLMIREELK